MPKHYVEAVKRLSTDKDGVVSLEYVLAVSLPRSLLRLVLVVSSP